MGDFGPCIRGTQFLAHQSLPTLLVSWTLYCPGVVESSHWATPPPESYWWAILIEWLPLYVAGDSLLGNGPFLGCPSLATLPVEEASEAVRVSSMEQWSLFISHGFVHSILSADNSIWSWATSSVFGWLLLTSLCVFIEILLWLLLIIHKITDWGCFYLFLVRSLWLCWTAAHQ